MQVIDYLSQMLMVSFIFVKINLADFTHDYHMLKSLWLLKTPLHSNSVIEKFEKELRTISSGSPSITTFIGSKWKKSKQKY